MSIEALTLMSAIEVAGGEARSFLTAQLILVVFIVLWLVLLVAAIFLLPWLFD